MSREIVEVKEAVVSTWDGEKLQVEGGAYLPPGEWLRTESELLQLRAKKAELEEKSLFVPSLVVGALVIGGLVGYWLGSDDDE